ncbi:MAG: PhnD/SsuA/transferrin family substrate-binding protein [Geobacteraceae bacterium]|nr:PhnD/SsuA/transferrin family substrate-binding protein [Geobacteraceae bacterium]
MMTFAESRTVRTSNRTQPAPSVPFLKLLALSLAIVLLGPVPFVFAGQWDGLPTTLRVGFSSRVFADVDQRDAQVAMELWSRELALGMGITTTPVTVIYKNSADLLEAVKRGDLAIVTLPAVEFLQIRDRAPMTPVIVAANNFGNAREYSLIVRRDSGIKSIADLRGKTIVLPSFIKNEASHIWLHVLLMREVKHDCTLFSRQTRESPASSKSILKVFFKQADAAIVSHGALATSNVLNPQIGRELAVITESKPLHGDITCVPNMQSDKLKLSIINSALHLHETTTGRQIFTLFQVERVIPYQPSYLQGLIALLNEQEKLKSNPAKRR